jgi:ATP-dependent DNA ligase
LEDIGLQMAYDTQGLTINIEHFSSFPDLYIAEPKYDGLRTACFIKDNTVEFVTRFGNPVYNIVDVKNDLLEQVQKQDLLNDFMLDGELYSRNWNETISITKTFRKDIKSTNIIFYVFDIIPIKDFENKNSNLLLKDRKSLLKRLVKNTNKIRKVDYTYIHDVKDAYILYDKFIEQNLEGIMLKRIDSKYKFRRTKDWLKVNYPTL